MVANAYLKKVLKTLAHFNVHAGGDFNDFECYSFFNINFGESYSFSINGQRYKVHQENLVEIKNNFEYEVNIAEINPVQLQNFLKALKASLVKIKADKYPISKKTELVEFIGFIEKESGEFVREHAEFPIHLQIVRRIQRLHIEVIEKILQLEAELHLEEGLEAKLVNGIKYDGNYENIIRLLYSFLIEKGCIPKTLGVNKFCNYFDGTENMEPINWIEKKVKLYFVVKKLHEKIKPTESTPWLKYQKLFRIKKKPVYNLRNSDPKKEYQPNLDFESNLQKVLKIKSQN